MVPLRNTQSLNSRPCHAIHNMLTPLPTLCFGGRAKRSPHVLVREVRLRCFETVCMAG
jgi:hypothetical protein